MPTLSEWIQVWIEGRRHLVGRVDGGWAITSAVRSLGPGDPPTEAVTASGTRYLLGGRGTEYRAEVYVVVREAMAAWGIPVEDNPSFLLGAAAGRPLDEMRIRRRA